MGFGSDPPQKVDQFRESDPDCMSIYTHFDHHLNAPAILAGLGVNTAYGNLTQNAFCCNVECSIPSVVYLAFKVNNMLHTTYRLKKTNAK